MPNLPSDKTLIVQLLDDYFANVHPLRCFGFVHKPTILAKLDDGITDGSDHHSLLSIMCALGAK
jgi:hypothetical protein